MRFERKTYEEFEKISDLSFSSGSQFIIIAVVSVLDIFFDVTVKLMRDRRSETGVPRVHKIGT